LGRILLDLGYVSGRQLSEILAIQSGIQRVNLDEIQIEPEVLGTVPAELVSKYSVIPLSRENGELTLAMADPFETQAIEELRMVTGLSIRRRFATGLEIERAIQRFYGSNVARMLQNLAPGEKQEKEVSEDKAFENGELSAAKLQELAREPSLINLVNLVLLEAIEARASDVHIEPFEKAVKIKYRVDGLLIEKSNSPKRLQAAIISRVKIMAGMDIAERYVPQDGHIEFAGKKGKIDIRVSTVPSIFGESITMRILDRSAALITMEDLGMVQRVPEPLARNRAGDGTDGQRQNDDAVRGPQQDLRSEFEDHHDRGPGGISARRRGADAGQPAARPDLRARSSSHFAAGPGHHHGRRNPRPGDGRYLRACGADGPLGP
jgi:type IV pilus assembly protein PilB